MNNFDLIKMALRNLAKRKVRTGLTILSVVIGASSIIIMISLGIALDESFDKQIENMGGITNITVSSYDKPITTDTLNKFKAIDGVVAVTPILEKEFKLIANNKYVGTFSFMGIDPSTMESFGYTPIEGRTLSSEDVGTYNLAINPYIQNGFYKKGKAEPYPRWIFSDEDITEDMLKVDLLDQKVKITTNTDFGVDKKYLKNLGNKSNNVKHKIYNANIVGIVNKAEQYANNYVFISLDTFEKIKKDIDKLQGNNNRGNNNQAKGGYERILIKCRDLNKVEDVMSSIKDIGEFQPYSQAEFINSTKKMTMSVQILLGAIGGISLFIAAIGITNTMVMSIYERTKEIGIMKVIGAKVSDIKRLFLLEAILIGFLGGTIGVLFSLTASYGLNKLSPLLLMYLGMGISGEQASKISSIPFWLSISSLLFSSVIGLIAGYFPARRAVKIEALKAIKAE